MMTIKKKKLPPPPMTIKYTVLLAMGVGSTEDSRSSRMGHTTLASSPSRGAGQGRLLGGDDTCSEG